MPQWELPISSLYFVLHMSIIILDTFKITWGQVYTIYAVIIYKYLFHVLTLQNILTLHIH